MKDPQWTGSDGFIHLSAAHQVRATAQKHFSGKADLLLVSVAEEALGHKPEMGSFARR